MENYPGAGMSLSQLVHALEKRLSAMMNRSFHGASLHEEEIDWAVAKFSSISTSLHQLKNSIAPINRLPPEILALIPTFRGSERDLVNATAVCKYWRETLTSAPNLWNNIVCSEKASRDDVSPRVHTYFERSGSVPVNVQIHARASRLLSPHAERISRLTMFLDNQLHLNEIGEHLSKPAPLLEAMTLRARRWDEDGMVLPPGFFGAFLSSVRTLTLHGTVLSPGPRQLSKLTKFILETRLTNVTSTILLDALEQMPLLRVFEARLGQVYQPGAVPRTSAVTLPHLEEMVVTIDESWFPPVACPVLPALRLPNARRVMLQLVGARGAPFTPVLPLSFGERLPNWVATPKASAALDKDRNGIEFLGLADSKLTLCTNSALPYAFTPTTFGGTPFESVRRLRVSFRNSVVDTVFFIHLLRSMTGLEHLQLKRNTTVPLGCWTGEDDQAGICPALSTLTIIDVDPTAEESVELLKRVREYAGVPIANVVILHSER